MSLTTIIVIVAVAAILFIMVGRKAGGSANGPAAVAMEMIENGAFILDVRTEGEFQSGAFPGAKNIPVNMVASRLNEIPKDKPIVVYCAAGGRSASAANLLKSRGYTDVVNAGGLSSLFRAQKAREADSR